MVTVGGTSETTVYTFDAVGNRLTKNIGGIDTSYVYDSNDRMTSDGTQTYTYDNNGNTLSDGIKTFSYDAKNRLESFESGADSVSYTYDTENLRTSKTVNGSTTNYILCKTCRYARVIEEIAGTGVLKRKYTYGNDLLGVSIEGGLDHGYVLDGHGSVRGMTYNGIIQAEYDYTAYGELTSESGWASDYNDFRYSGEQYDPDLDQYYLRSRYYNQNVGRFSSMDTWQGSLSRPLSLNKYNYTESNPVMGVDPSGKFTILGMMAGINAWGEYFLSAIPMPGKVEPDWLQFDGTKRKIIWFKGIPWDEKNSKPKKIYKGAFSGKMGYQKGIEENYKSPNFGPIPPGKYFIKTNWAGEAPSGSDGKNVWLSGSNGGIETVPEIGNPPLTEAWGTLRARIFTFSGTNTYGRSNFYLHNSGKGYSSGCIDVAPPDGEQVFVDLSQLNGKRVDLMVKY